MTPNSEQAFAIQQLVEHLNSRSAPLFITLKGPAGTGKTFTMQFVARDFKRQIIFTAPTNKAVRVLREALTSDHYKNPACRTIYSLLGLQMLPNGEVKELTKSEDPVDLSDVYAVVIDEASMISPVLLTHITEASQQFPHIRWIFMGDPYQLPPVGEAVSPVWELPGVKTLELTKVMRQDNQILQLAQHLRERVATPFGKLLLKADNDGTEGIWMHNAASLENLLLDRADEFLRGEARAIAWRNAIVGKYNQRIRERLFADTLKYPWQVGDRIALLEPVKNLDGEVVGTTDEEGAVEQAEEAPHPVYDIACWRVRMRSDMNTVVPLWIPTVAGNAQFIRRKERLASEARVTRSKWKDFWEFSDAFAKVRYAYAITAHRAQGSTYTKAFVSWSDILSNPNRAEALRCLYVAATRPRKELHLG